MSDPAGYVIVNETAIWVTGSTPNDAWANFQRDLGFADVDAKIENERHEAKMCGMIFNEPKMAERIERRRQGFSIHSATPALLAQVEADGGNIAWGTIGKVACTIAEYDVSMENGAS